MRHTVWRFLIGCVNMKWIQLVLWKLQSGQDFVHRRTDGWTDGQTDGRPETSIPPVNFVEARGMISVIYLFQNNDRRLLHNWHISYGLHNYTHQNIDMDCHRILYFPHCPRVQHHFCSNIRQGWQARSKGRETRRGVGDVSVPGNI